MSIICSKVESLDKLRFEPLTAKVVAVTKMTNINGTIVALGKDGTIYTTGVVRACGYPSHGEEGSRIGRVLDGCIKLGILSAAAVREHRADVAERAAKRDHNWNSEQLRKYSAKLGIKLTEKQRSALYKEEEK